MSERMTPQSFLESVEKEEQKKKKKRIAKAGGILGAGAVVTGLGAHQALREEPRSEPTDRDTSRVQRIDPTELARERAEARPEGLVLPGENVIPVDHGRPDDASVAGGDDVSHGVYIAKRDVFESTVESREIVPTTPVFPSRPKEETEPSFDDVDLVFGDRIEDAEGEFDMLRTLSEEDFFDRLDRNHFLPCTIDADSFFKRQMTAMIAKLQSDPNSAVAVRVRRLFENLYAVGMQHFDAFLLRYPRDGDDSRRHNAVLHAQRRFKEWFSAMLPKSFSPIRDINE